MAPQQTGAVPLRLRSAVLVHSDSIVDEVMRRWPATIRVFLRHRMRCIGCPLGQFHTIDYACREHGVDRDRFMADLNAVVAEAEARGNDRRATFKAPSPRRP